MNGAKTLLLLAALIIGAGYGVRTLWKPARSTNWNGGGIEQFMPSMEERWHEQLGSATNVIGGLVGGLGTLFLVMALRDRGRETRAYRSSRAADLRLAEIQAETERELAQKELRDDLATLRAKVSRLEGSQTQDSPKGR